MLQIIIIIVAIVLILAGIVGIFLPILPGVPLVFLGVLVYGIYDGFNIVTPVWYIIMGLLTVVSLLMEYATSTLGAKKFGASKWGMFGAFFGAMLGLAIFNFLGLIIGMILGTVLFELIAGKKWQEAVKAGSGAFFGFLGGSMVKMILALAIIGIFVRQLLM